MSRFRNAISARDNHIWTLRGVCVVLVLLLVTALGGWMMAPSKLMIHNPPDLRNGSTRPYWEVDPGAVYTFAFYIFQQLNSWPTDGAKDYPRRIAGLAPYLTPQCKAFLEEDATQRNNRGELSDRVRGITEIPGRGYKPASVKIVDRDNWVVTLDVSADEYYHAESVKRALVRYPLKVTRWESDADRNPMGLAFDCYAEVPQRLEAAPKPEAKAQGVFQ